MYVYAYFFYTFVQSNSESSIFCCIEQICIIICMQNVLMVNPLQINGSNPKCVEYYNTYQLISSLAKNDLKLAVEIQLI